MRTPKGAVDTPTLIPLPRLIPDPVQPRTGIDDELLAFLRGAALEVEAGALRRTDDIGEMVLLDADLGGDRVVLLVTRSAPQHPLSPRELQIVRLVATGHTNRTIARELDISSWTVSTHLRRIFAKLGVCSRAEMVARVFGTLNQPTPRGPLPP